jgi:hypothetical protein
MSNKNESSLGHASVLHIRNSLDRIFKKGSWHDWELETISDELKTGFDELTRDKIHVLQLMLKDPDLFFTNATFFLHAVKVMNNDVADFDRLPMPTSLELAFALVEYKKLLGPAYKAPAKDSMVTDVVAYLLNEEGYSEPLPPFDFVPAERLAKGQLPSDTEAKKKAIEVYINAMDNL